jgi:hypothetical protein
MSIEYRLILAGDAPVGWVAERAFPDPDERPVGTPPLLAADLYDRYGFDITVRAGRNGYVEIPSADGIREWEPESYIALTFRMEKSDAASRAVTSMITVVRRVLGSGPEDAVLTLNVDSLLLTRFDGVLVKNDGDGWWASYPAADDLI